MKRNGQLTISWTEVDSINDLDADDQMLLNEARAACTRAYAPYSAFHVGAALRLDDGTIITGANVENAAFPSGICAERNVLSTFVSGYPGKKPVTMAIEARNTDGVIADMVSPCGNCRQVIAEEEHRSGTHIKLILSSKNKIMIFNKIDDLLPLRFTPDSLRSNLP
ncbi:MAG: cytidine deaminase [Bacteroidales bacterium]